MRIIETIVKGLVVAGLALNIASCCCTGATDDNNPPDTDLNLPLPPHNEGGGGNV